jgi:peptidoglycan/xylan/chitin deacetylase (PgdA/CDA1 family)
MKIVQCWDDGVNDDIRLIEILRRHNAKASFNLNYSTHKETRGPAWSFRGLKEVHRLARSELSEVYEGFTIANHSLGHPHLEQLEPAAALQEIREGRDTLEQHFGVPITGFAYPFGSYDEAVIEMVRETGHVYARTCVNLTPCFPPADPITFHPDCHFLDANFWDKFQQASEQSEVFYFWGHSYELVTEDDWTAFEQKIEKISAQPNAQWADLPDLFPTQS